jgi:hypothetical protein
VQTEYALVIFQHHYFKALQMKKRAEKKFKRQGHLANY